MLAVTVTAHHSLSWGHSGQVVLAGGSGGRFQVVTATPASQPGQLEALFE